MTMRTLAILALSMLGGVFSDRVVFAGGHNNSGNHNHSSNGNHNNKPSFSLGNKVLTGNKNGLGFIADPARRSLKINPTNNTSNNSNPPKGNFIADPLHLPTGNPTRVTPVVRDHGLTNPNPIMSPPRQRYDSIQGGGLGLDLNPFDFQAPMNFDNQVRDHRTQTTGFPGSGQTGPKDPKKGGHDVWQPNSTGPANRSPVKP
jgi:hypothetical protein